MSINALIVGEREFATVLVALCFWQSAGQSPLGADSPGDLLCGPDLERLISRLEHQACSGPPNLDFDSRLAQLIKSSGASAPAEPVVDPAELVQVHLPFLEMPARQFAVGNPRPYGQYRMDADVRRRDDLVVETA